MTLFSLLSHQPTHLHTSRNTETTASTVTEKMVAVKADSDAIEMPRAATQLPAKTFSKRGSLSGCLFCIGFPLSSSETLTSLTVYWESVRRCSGGLLCCLRWVGEKRRTLCYKTSRSAYRFDRKPSLVLGFVAMLPGVCSAPFIYQWHCMGSAVDERCRAEEQFQ